MDGLSWFLIAAIGVFWLQTQVQRQRVGLLAKHLAPTQVEKILGTLIDGYLNAAAEANPERQQQMWLQLNQQEQRLVEHFQRFVDGFAKEPAEQTRVSTLPWALPYFDRIFPATALTCARRCNCTRRPSAVLVPPTICRVQRGATVPSP